MVPALTAVATEQNPLFSQSPDNDFLRMISMNVLEAIENLWF
jgi:hypothetical protein